MVGDNGRVWIDGSAEGTSWARSAITLASRSGHKLSFEAELSALENDAPKRGDA
jgi:exosome complex RNA-binding protein Rrp4